MYTRIFASFVVFIFIASFGVLARADEWRNFVYAGNITSLCASSSTIWIGTEGGVVALDKPTGKLTQYTRAEGLVELHATDISIGDDGSLWAVGQSSDLAEFVGTNWISVPPPPEGLQGDRPQAQDLAIDHDGVKWLTTYAGVLCLDEHGWTTFEPANSPLETRYLESVEVDQNNTKWFSTHNYPPDNLAIGVYSFDGQNWEHYTTENSGLHTDNVGPIGVDADGGVWFCGGFGAGRGASRLLDGVWTTYTEARSGVLQIATDHDGNLWFATNWTLQRFDGIDWFEYSAANSPLPGEADGAITSICFDADGVLWVGTDAHGLFSFDGQDWNVTDITFSGPAALYITQLAMLPPGGVMNASMWMIYHNSYGVITNYDYSTNAWLTYTPENSPISGLTRTVVIDQDGVLWLGTSNGIYSVDNNIWSDHTRDPATLPTPWWDDIFFAAVDSENVKWFCHGAAEDASGIEHLVITSFDGVDWKAHDFGLYVRPGPKCFAEDPDGGKWFGYRFGLLYFDGVNHAIFNPENSPLPWKKIGAIMIEDNWEMWIASDWSNDNASLLHFDGESFETLTTANCGLASDEIRTLTRDAQGKYWFGILRSGVSVFDGEGWITLDTDTSSISSNWINRVAFDFLDNCWMATREGLSVLMNSLLANHYPQEPTVIADWQTAQPGEFLSFSSTATDPDGDGLEFRLQWPDGTTSEWSAGSQSWSSSEIGRYYLRASARDSRKAVSRWSTPMTVTVMNEYAPFIDIWANRTAYRQGQMLRAAVVVENRGPARQVKAAFGVELPDGTRLFYPDYAASKTTFDLSLVTDFKFGPYIFCELPVSDSLPAGRYNLFAELLDASTGDHISDASVSFDISESAPL
ncbi:MAG: hypothetical protein JW941_01265 [Candidatus Coatesbacteria bacterium]|nr:hypothetical protein [Candidatus Coatesbacteria bacterium]